MSPSEPFRVNPEERVEMSLEESEQRGIPSPAGLVDACAHGHGRKAGKREAKDALAGAACCGWRR